MAEVLIVADEIPAMQVLARRLQAEEQTSSQLIDQDHRPARLGQYQAVVVYIHKELHADAERAFIDYAENGGRLVLLHHSISSGKRQNRDWFKFLGVELPQGTLEQGGYKWIEGVTVTWVNRGGDHYIMTNHIQYPQLVAYAVNSPHQQHPVNAPAFTLHDTEVYLNHVLSGPRTLLMGLEFTELKGGKTWMQDTAGWLRPAGKGWVVYFMPGHTLHDFENPVYGRIVLNAITAPPSVLSRPSVSRP